MSRFRSLRRSQTGAAADLLAAAFHEDPFFEWLFPDPETRPVLGRAWMRVSAQASLDLGHAYGLLDGESLVGASLWAPPDADLFGSGRFASLWHLAVGANPTRLDEMRDGFRLLSGAHPKDEAHYYLNTLGVDPGRRGKGDGRRVVEPILELADRDGVPTYLESSNPRNLSFYDRLGFSVLDEVRIAENGPVMRPMWRPVPHT